MNSEKAISAAWEALGQVVDPETDISVVDMGLVYGVEDTEDGLRVRLTLTHPSCPMGGLILERAEAALAGVSTSDYPVRVELAFDPPWTPDRITAEGRRQLG
jgi:metal-sulfur cluster biosynthetic enzyme